MPQPQPGRAVAPVVRRLAGGVLVFALLLPAAAGVPARDGGGQPRATVEEAIEAAAGYLVRAARDDGLFVYRINTNPAVKVRPAYNLLRHAGTLYAMAMHYADEPDPAMRAAMLRAGGFLRDRAIAPLPEDEKLLAVWSRPEVIRKDRPLQAKLGGAGLGLVSLIGLEGIEPGFTPLEMLKGLGRFIVFMQKSDGSFYSKYIPSTGGRDDSWTSLYYPGEAALGLLMLHELDPSGPWFEAAGKALDYLARVREGARDVPADHWALLATAKMLSIEDAEMAPDLRARLIGHAVQNCEAILAQQIDGPGPRKVNGGFSADGRVTPTATRLEGLLAARDFLPAEAGLGAPIDTAVERGIGFLLRAQIRDGDFAGGFPRAIATLPPDLPDAARFNRRATEVRIDYVQHALSALIQYRATLPTD